MQKVWLNGTIIDRSKALISIDDRGFRFGDGVFETILVRENIPYLWQAHMRRLEQGLEALHITCDLSELHACVSDLYRANNMSGDSVLRIMVTRGSGSSGYRPKPISQENTMALIEIFPIPTALKKPKTLWLSHYCKNHPGSIPARAKTMQGLNSTLAIMEAESEDCDDALLLSVSNHVAECHASNIFWSKGKVLYTPALNTGCLPGVLRERLIEISPYPVRAGRFKLSKLLKADGVFTTNSTRLVEPVESLKRYKSNWEASEKLAKIFQMHVEQDISADLEQRKTLAFL